MEEQIKAGKIKGKTGIDLAKEFNLKYPDKKFFFGGRETLVTHKSINSIIQGNPNLKKKDQANSRPNPGARLSKKIR